MTQSADCLLQDAIEQAKAYKASGNAHFTAQRTTSAIDDYRLGIACLPVRPKPKPKKPKLADGDKGKGRADESDDEDDYLSNQRPNDSARSASTTINGSGIRELDDDDDAEEFVNGDQRTQEERDLTEIRSTLWANIAACHLRTVGQSVV